MALAPLPSRDVPTPLPDDPTLDGDGPEDDDPLDGRMTFLEHLDELRKRITHAVIALLSGFVVASIFSNRIQAFVYERLTADLPERKFIYTEPGEGFFLWVKISALAGVLVASPYIMLPRPCLSPAPPSGTTCCFRPPGGFSPASAMST